MPILIKAVVSSNFSCVLYHLSGLSNRIGNSTVLIRGSGKILPSNEPELDSIVWAHLPDDNGSRIFITRIAYSFITDGNTGKTRVYSLLEEAKSEDKAPKKKKFGFLRKCFS